MYTKSTHVRFLGYQGKQNQIEVIKLHTDTCYSTILFRSIPKKAPLNIK